MGGIEMQFEDSQKLQIFKDATKEYSTAVSERKKCEDYLEMTITRLEGVASPTWGKAAGTSSYDYEKKEIARLQMFEAKGKFEERLEQYNGLITLIEAVIEDCGKTSPSLSNLARKKYIDKMHFVDIGEEENISARKVKSQIQKALKEAITDERAERLQNYNETIKSYGKLRNI